MDDLRSSGFEAPEGLFYWSSRFANLGATNRIFVAKKPAAPDRFNQGDSDDAL
jgi:hypothetical protein